MEVVIFFTNFQYKYFEEIHHAVMFDLRKKGYIVHTQYELYTRKECPTIFFGANYYAALIEPTLRKSDIIFQLEQLFDGSPYDTSTYLSLLQKCRVWDYNIKNQEWLTLRGISSEYVPIRHSPTFLFTLKEADRKDIDILFYGTLNPKRMRILEKIQQCTQFKIVIRSDLFGMDKESLILRSKIILNLHFYCTSRTETTRLGPLLSNGCFVISEMSSNPEENKEWEQIIPIFHNVTELCSMLTFFLENPEKRLDVQKKSQALYQKSLFTTPL